MYTCILRNSVLVNVFVLKNHFYLSLMFSLSCAVWKLKKSIMQIFETQIVDINRSQTGGSTVRRFYSWNSSHSKANCEASRAVQTLVDHSFWRYWTHMFYFFGYELIYSHWDELFPREQTVPGWEGVPESYPGTDLQIYESESLYHFIYNGSKIYYCPRVW